MTAASITAPMKHAPSRWTSAAGLLVAAVVLCACRTSTGVFANLAAAQTESQDACRATDGAGIGGPIPPAALVMLVEATKLLISLVLWNLEERRPQLEQLLGPGPGGGPSAAKAAAGPLPPAEPLLDRRFFLFAPPAALYCSCNVLWLIALQRMAAPVFEMLSTLRILLSVALAWAFTQSGAQLRLHHYAALGMLVAANLVAQWGMGVGAAPRLLDVLLVLLSISSSAVANMLFELLTKERFLAVSLHLQNIQLYTWGVAFNAATFAAMQRGGGAAAALSLAWLPCANVWHVLLILAFACVGIVTGIVLKYHGNVASVVAQSFAVHLSALLSHMSIRFTPSWQFLAGAALCQAAILLYNRDSLWPRKA